MFTVTFGSDAASSCSPSSPFSALSGIMAKRAIIVFFRALAFVEPVVAIRLILVLIISVSIEGSEASLLGRETLFVSLRLNIRQVIFDHLLQSVVGWLGPLQ